MNEDLRLVIGWLLEASAQIPSDYCNLPVAGQEDPIYRERVYCYELYHQWRRRWYTGNYTLCGEIDKQGHPIIRCVSKPDFLVHSPGTMTNLLAMEVKPANARIEQMIKDLNTLTYFRRMLGDGQNYHHACFWVYGANEQMWCTLGTNLRDTAHSSIEIDLALIQPAIHPRAGEPSVFFEWP